MKKKKRKSSGDGMTIPSDYWFHYRNWTEDLDVRMTRPGGWNDVTDAYWGKLPPDFPFNNRVVDPRIRTSIQEKTARLLNAKLRGRLVPREGNDILKARIQNAILDFQWDAASQGGTMLEKWSYMDTDARLYGSRFALVKWRYEVNDEGEVIFNGNEFRPIDVRDVGIDFSATHVRDAKWVQVREWSKLEDLKDVNDGTDSDVYMNLDELERRVKSGQNRRDNAYLNRVLQLKGLEDRVGTDPAFPVIEVVTEYRRDKWVTFCPRYNLVIRECENPYEHNMIPVVQLRYYPITGDVWGESEVAHVLPLWLAIQFHLCGFLDAQQLYIKPPLKVRAGSVDLSTVIFGPEAQWHVQNPDDIVEFNSNGESIRNFQATYTALVSAFNTAMGDISQGISNLDPTATQKTATEVKNSYRQQNVRDMRNQNSLSEAIQDMMLMWVSNNKQFLFSDPEQQQYLLKILGTEEFNYFKRSGLDQMELTPEGMKMVQNIIDGHEGDIGDEDINTIVESVKVPKFPVFDNPQERNPEKLLYKPKMAVSELGDAAELTVVPEDLDGIYDYIPSVKSMSTGAEEELTQGRLRAIDMLTGNPNIVSMLAQEGVKPEIKDLLVTVLEDAGLTDAERYFSKTQESNQQQEQSANPQQPQLPAPEMGAHKVE